MLYPAMEDYRHRYHDRKRGNCPVHPAGSAASSRWWAQQPGQGYADGALCGTGSAWSTGWNFIRTEELYDDYHAFCPGAGVWRSSGNGAIGAGASRSRGTPRLANRLLKRVRDFAQVKYDGVITESRWRIMPWICWTWTSCGLDNIDRTILLTMIEKFSGRPCGTGHIVCIYIRRCRDTGRRLRTVPVEKWIYPADTQGKGGDGSGLHAPGNTAFRLRNLPNAADEIGNNLKKWLVFVFI